MRINVRMASGRHCEISPFDHWTVHDLQLEIQSVLEVPVAQQRLIHDGRLLQRAMGAAAVGTVGQLLKSSGGAQETSLELLMLVRSTAVVEALEAVRRNGLALEFASKHMKGDREVVMEAVKKHGLTLSYASEELKGDREVVIEAVKHNGDALSYASEELKGDREVVIEAVKQHGDALWYASKQLKTDSEVLARRRATPSGCAVVPGGPLSAPPAPAAAGATTPGSRAGLGVASSSTPPAGAGRAAPDARRRAGGAAKSKPKSFRGVEESGSGVASPTRKRPAAKEGSLSEGRRRKRRLIIL